MRLDDERQSDQVDDRRGDDGSGGGGAGLGSVGLGGALLALAAGWFFGIDPGTVMHLLQAREAAAPVHPSAPARAVPPADAQAVFVAKVLASTEDVWSEVFRARRQTYRKPRLVLFSGRTGTACGTGQTAQGPFYCPADEHVYIDLDFYHDLQTRFHAPGEFAQAYVIAHEVGHHVQKLRGISDRVTQAQRAAGSQAAANRLSVRLELQADCFAGVWGHWADQRQHLLDAGEAVEALRAAAAIGDDTLQQQARGRVVPDSFTHGTSQERVYWFQRGMQSGDPRQCDPFRPGAMDAADGHPS